MNSGAFGENFPYSNFHDLNMDWIIKIAKDFLDQYTHIQEVIEQGEESLTELTETGLQDLQTKYETLEGLLQQWYNTHSNDIANELADALQDISGALTSAVASFTQQANAKAQETIATIPDDYSALSAEVQRDTKQLAHTTGNEIELSHNLQLNKLELFGIGAEEGTLYRDIYRACSTLIPLHKGQVIKNLNESTMLFGMYRYDRFGNYITYDVWYSDLYPITIDGLYRIVLRSVNNTSLENVIDTLDSSIIIQDLYPSIPIRIEANEKHGYFFTKKDIVQGGYYYCIAQNIPSNRIRTPFLIPVSKGTNFGFVPAGVEIRCDIYEDTDADTPVESHDWNGSTNNYTIQHDGFMTINIRNANNANITPNDFNGYISITPKASDNIVVDINGNGDTTLFSEAVLQAFIHANTTIYVKPGEYDIEAELKQMYGSNFFEAMLSTYYLANGLPWGNGTKIIGSNGAILKFDASNITNTLVHHDFSILFGRYVDNGYTQKNSIEGLTILTTKNRYCIHLDQGAIPNDYIYEIKNCTMRMDNSLNTEIHASDCIGIGASINTTFIIENNYLYPVFAQDARDNEVIYYHNTNANSPSNKLIIKDNYLAGLGTIRTDQYGDSHNRCIIQITGNSVGSPMLLGSISGDHFRYLVWDNEVRT